MRVCCFQPYIEIYVYYTGRLCACVRVCTELVCFDMFVLGSVHRECIDVNWIYSFCIQTNYKYIQLYYYFYYTITIYWVFVYVHPHELNNNINDIN